MITTLLFELYLITRYNQKQKKLMKSTQYLLIAHLFNPVYNTNSLLSNYVNLYLYTDSAYCGQLQLPSYLQLIIHIYPDVKEVSKEVNNTKKFNWY